MKEIKDILNAYEIAQKKGLQTALATVVHVEGSSYRRPGARMLVTEDGQLTGAISGGCLEGDALRKALLAIHHRQNKLVTYDTTDEDDLRFGVQLGCNGIVHILFEPIDPDSPVNPIILLRTLAASRKDAVLTTLFSLDRTAYQPGTCVLFTATDLQTSLPEIPPRLTLGIRQSFNNQTSDFISCMIDKRQIQAFLEFVPPPPCLVIAGAGNDAIPLVTMAAMLGWHIIVADGRPEYALPARFPLADKIIVARPNAILPQIPAGKNIFVLMTHNYNYDLALLGELLHHDFRYTGILGPRKKWLRMLEDLHAKDIHPSQQQLAAIHAPIGLDIGSETAEEIALSIIAEIKAALADRSAAPLRQKLEAIHSKAPINI